MRPPALKGLAGRVPASEEDERAANLLSAEAWVAPTDGMLRAKTAGLCAAATNGPCKLIHGPRNAALPRGRAASPRPNGLPIVEQVLHESVLRHHRWALQARSPDNRVSLVYRQHRSGRES